MKNTREDNTVSVIRRVIKYFKIPVTCGTIKESLKAHSRYPTFKSICDVLTEWKIENYPLKYSNDEIANINPPYIAHFKGGGGQLVFVTEESNGSVHYFDSYKSEKTVGLKEFTERSSGAVILLNPDAKSGEKDYRKNWQNEVINNSVLPLLTATAVLFIVTLILTAVSNVNLTIDNTFYLLMLTKITGIVFSVFLVLHEYDIHTAMSDKICHINKATNCNTVLNDKASKVFGWFGWSDAGFIYFTGGILFLLQSLTVKEYSILVILSALALPYPVYSVYYQGFVLRKWCPFCLGVQIILISEFLILLPQFSDLTFSISATTNFILTFLVVFVVYILANLYFREKIENEVHYYKYLGFKKNPVILRTLLSGQKHYDIPCSESGLLFGDKDASLEITAFLSLHCSHCARAFEKIRNIVSSEDKVTIKVFLVTSDKKILNTLYHYKNNGKENEALDLLDQWFNADPYSRSRVSDALCIPDADDISNEVSDEIHRLFKEYNVAGTPTFFINGYKLPRQYDIDDVKYFHEGFKEETLGEKDVVNNRLLK